MDTTTAAQQAGVTVATIRTWCRIGAVAARKVAGRWTIDAASLAYRLTLSRKAHRMATHIQAPASGAMIVYFGNLTDPANLRKLEIRRTRAFLSARMGLTDPNASVGSAARPVGSASAGIGQLIPDAEESALIDGLRALGGRATPTGGRFRHNGDVTEILALATRLWGEPTGTATEYDETPTPVGA